MKKFIIMSLFFFTILLCLSSVFYYLLDRELKQSKLYFYYGWNDIYKSNINSNVIIMGSSRAWVQFSPIILDSILNVNSYNLGVDGCPIDMQVLKYNTFRRYNKKPQYIIHDIDLSTIELWNGYCKEQLFPYLSDDSLFNQVKDKYTFIEKNIPFMRYSGFCSIIEAGLKFRIPRMSAHTYKGYQGQDIKWEGSALSKISNISFHIDTIAEKIFDNYLRGCINDSIKVIFVYPPLYIGATEKFTNIDSMFAFYENISQKYDIPIMNYTYDSLCYDTLYFYNAMHLNKLGSELFSTKLANDLDSLGILK